MLRFLCRGAHRATLAVASSSRTHSQSFHKGEASAWSGGELVAERQTSSKSFQRLNPANLQHFVKAKIQEDRKERGLTEVDDWVEFCKDAVLIPTKHGPTWCGPDDPRVEKFVARREKRKVQPAQVARKAPGVDPAVKLQEHPFRKCFTTPSDLKDPMSIADGLYKAGRIKEYDLKFTASKLTWVPRPPIVTIMGHVDHGKTTLLDFLRKSNVAAGEAGGITQSIGAFTVEIPSSQSKITFIDTPGHKAFSEMRKAGVQATDIIVLVVSVTDGVQPQTLEVLELARANQIPLVVAANKIDKGVGIHMVKEQLKKHGVEFEEDGGETQIVGISALEGTNVAELLEAVQLQAALLDIHEPVPSRCEITVIDSKSQDNTEVAGIVRCGEITPGMTLVGGANYAVVTRLLDEHGQEIKKAKVSCPVLLRGFKMLPKPGTILMQVSNEVHGKNFYDLMRDVYNVEGKREQYLNILNLEANGLIYNRKPDGNVRRMYDATPFNLILKAQSFGQLQALLSLLYALPSLDGVTMNIRIHEVGGISDSDIVILTNGEQPGAILVFGKNMKHSHHVSLPSFLDLVEFDVVYHGVEWVKAKLVSLMPKIEEVRVLASATVKQTFKASKAGKTGNAAGVLVTKGNLSSAALTVRVMRRPKKDAEPEEVYSGRIKDLRRFKESVQVVEEGLECGLVLFDEFSFKEGDVIEEVETYVVERDVEQTYAEAEERERQYRMRMEQEAAERGVTETPEMEVPGPKASQIPMREALSSA